MANTQNNKLNGSEVGQLSLKIAEYLQGYVPAEFPSDVIRTQIQSFADNCEIHTFQIASKTCLGLTQLAKSLSIEPGITFVAAIRILHFRYAGINQAALSLCATPSVSTTDGAVVHESKDNTVTVLCIPVDAEDALSTVAKKTAETVLIASQHSEAAIADAAAKLGWKKNNELGSATSVVISLEDSKGRESYASALRGERFEMEWRFHPVGDTFECDIIYNRALFKTERIRDFAENFIDVIEFMFHEPGLAVEEVPFGHALEQLRQDQIPVTFPSQMPRGSLSESFSAAATEHKEKIALVDGGLRLTYSELDILSSALAKKISDIALGQDKCELISFCIPPSALAILAILGIIKYGAAYVPLDVRFPNERLEALLCDSGARILITTLDSPMFASTLSHVTRLDISDFLNDWKSSPNTTRAAEALPSYPRQTDLAYVMYTSGSTGRPKGVLMEQSSVLAFVSSQETIGFGPSYTVAQITNLAWDASTIDVWCTLLSGATLVCFDRFDMLDPTALAKLFKAFTINCCVMSPALFRQMVDVAPDLFSELRTFILGGESVYYESLQKLREINHLVMIQNMYGPTETCVAATAFSQRPQEMSVSGLMPIGRPLKTTQVLVVDKNGRLVPPGMLGELIIGGEGVARGYLNRPIETSQGFVEMTFEGLDQPPSIFYRSGDVVKWRSDGQLQFVGRLNIGQVKIRGQRLELAEVEGTIVRTGLVKSAAVTHFKPKDGRDPYLVAYVVMNTPSQTPIDDNVGSKSEAKVDNGSSKLVETWRELYDDMYSGYDINEARAQFLGWDSMVTGLPIPQDEMIAWLHDTLRPFFQQRPRTIFEVGCGIGIFLHEMAPFVDHLWAIEPSGEAVQKLKAQIRANNIADKFSIWHGPADRIPQLPSFQSEFVLINSVVQYLPSEAYLRAALVNIVDRCAQGSRILLGDIRSLLFEDLLGIDIILHEWKNELEAHTIQNLRDRIVTRNQNRTELLVDPTFFFDLQRAVPAISHVEIIPKVMEKSNELSQYRYQVILHVHEELTAIVPEKWLDYEKLGWNPSSLEDVLRDFVAGEETVLAVERVPNKFISWTNAVALVVFSPSTDAGAKLSSLSSRQSATELGWSAWDLERLAERFGVTVRLSFARQSQTTGLDAVFIKTSMSSLPYIAFKSTDGDISIPSFSSRSLEALGRSGRPEWEILEQLKVALPTYMIPEAIYSISSLPLLTNGKLDRRRVLSMAEADAGRGFVGKVSREITAPANVLEARICEIFGTVLSYGTVSPTADFFSIGGHSLLVARLKAVIEAEFGVRITQRDIFSGPTPRMLASKIKTLPLAVDSGISLSQKEGAGTPLKGQYYPLSFAQGRLWFLSQAAGPEDVSYNSGIFWKLLGNLQIEALRNTIREIVSRHEVLRTIFVEVHGVPRTQVLDSSSSLDIVSVPLGTSLEEVQNQVQNFMLQPFKLDSEPAFRACLFQISTSESILALSIHHIIWDGYSMDVIRKEFMELYHCFNLGERHTLTRPHIQYKEFAQWQRSDEFENLVQQQMEYWKPHLLDCQPAVFPLDSPRPSHRSGKAGFYSSPCKSGLLDRLENICQRERVTPFMWLLTAFRVVHYQLTGQEDASLGYPIANRNRLETGKLLGFFVNTQIFRLKLYSGATFLELLQQTQQLLYLAYENQDVPFDRLVSVLNPDRDLSRNPLVQIMSTYETAETSAFSFSGIDASTFELPINTTRLDLEVYFRKREGELYVDFCYSTDLFKKSTISHLAKRIHRVLEYAMEDPNFAISPDDGPANAMTPIVRDLINYLQDYTPAELPLDHTRSTTTTPKYQVYQFSLPQEICKALKMLLTFGGLKESSLLLLAALRILHFRYSGSEDAAIGLRMLDGISSQSTVVVRLPIHGDTSMLSVLEGTRNAVATVSKYSDLTFPYVVTELLSHEGAACDSIVRIMLTLAAEGTQHGSIIHEEGINFDMEWRFQAIGDTFTCELIYNCGLFKAERMGAFSNNFVDTINFLFLESEMTVENVPFSQALAQLKQARVPIDPPTYVPRNSLAESFAAAATEYKEKIALIDGELRLTYSELDLLSSALAKKISEAAQGQDNCELISFCIPPSALAILAILAIIKYGAAYVPLDVRFPDERLEALLCDSGAGMLITTFDSPTFATRQSYVTRLDISDFLDDWRSSPFTGNRDTAPLTSYPRQTDLAYIMYTSGTTGKPKGVPMAQSSVLAFMSNHETFGIRPGRIVAQINNLAWDASVIDIWSTLLSGALLVCFNRFDILDPPVLAKQFNEFNIDCCFMSPALFVQMIDVAPDLFSTLRTFIIGGEPFYYESLWKAREINRSMTIVSSYGPTETCVITTTLSLAPNEEMPKSGLVPIGRPVKTAQVLVVDKKSRLVPPGMLGELIVGGEGVARGYLNRPVETSQGFVEMEFEGLEQPRSIFYRSGDVVKWRPDGQLQFVSRLNIGQIKIRGQRLELAEVEAIIMRTGLVKSAAVTYLKPADGGHPYLVAYVVEPPRSTIDYHDSTNLSPSLLDTKEDGRPLQRRLLDHLQVSSPSFMVPRVVRSVSSLPLLPTGKLDRRQLEIQASLEAESLEKVDAPFEASHNDIEKQLCECFEQLLGRAPIYRSSDFFANGGHSLLAQRLTARIQSIFNIPLEVADIFDAPTPKAMAIKVRNAIQVSEQPPDN